MERAVSTSTVRGVANVVIDRPDDENRLTAGVLEELLALCGRLKMDRAVNVVTITGGGETIFSTGLLTPQLKANLGKEGVLALVHLANETFDAIEALPQIVIAGVNGVVRAGAVELMLACDLRIAAQHSTMAMPEAKWGGFPGAGAPVRLPPIVGGARALELICSGREIGAAEMERIGLVQRVVPASDLKTAVSDLADTIAQNGPLAIRGAKKIARTRMEPGFKAARELSDALRQAFEWTNDADEGIAAHLENRRPRFEGA